MRFVGLSGQEASFNLWYRRETGLTERAARALRVLLPALTWLSLLSDGVTDGSDFGIWNTYKFTSATRLTGQVPEPTGILPAALVWLLAVRRW